MSVPDIVIKYEGGDAHKHNVEMRVLGHSLIGFERIISDGLIFLGEGRLPKRGQRHPLIVQAREPVIGSSEIPVLLTQGHGLLPLGWWLLEAGAGEAVSYFMTYVFAKLGSRPREAQGAYDAMVKMREIDAKERLAAREIDANERIAMHDRQMARDAEWRDQLFALTNKLANSAINAVKPVGPSVDKFRLNGSKAPPFIVDLATADAIRARGELEVTELQPIELRVDGFVHHSKKLNVENPECPGKFISADVRDPNFEAVPNHYTEAAANKSMIRVLAKLGYRSGVLERIYIMDVTDLAA